MKTLAGIVLFLTTFLVSVGAAAHESAMSAGQSYGAWDGLLGHPGIQYRLRCDNCGQPGAHMWWVQFRNDQPERVAFDFRIAAMGSTVKFSDRLIIDPGKTAEGWNSVQNDQYSTPMVYTANWKSGPNAS